jgi:hypothetical protein
VQNDTLYNAGAYALTAIVGGLTLATFGLAGLVVLTVVTIVALAFI